MSQAGLAVAFAQILRARPGLPRVDLYALLTRFSQASATIAAQDYLQRRASAGIRSQFTVPHAAPPSAEQFSRTLDWVYSAPSASTIAQPAHSAAATDTQSVEVRMEAAMTRLAIQTGRETTVEAVTTDPQARAWARETRGNCCYFCAMLATRGAIYKSEHTAGRSANERFVGEGEFKYHNHCRCIAVPVFGVYEKTAEARAWTRQWHDLRRELGYSPSLLQWRQEFEGRRKPQNVPHDAGN